MISFIIGLAVGYFLKDQITSLVIKAKNKISDYLSN